MENNQLAHSWERKNTPMQRFSQAHLQMTRKKSIIRQFKEISKSYQISGLAFYNSHENRCWDLHGK